MPGSSRWPGSSSATATTVLATTGAGCTSCRTGRVTRQRARIGMVFQQFNLFGHLTVLENVIEGPVAAGVQRKQAAATASELLDRVGLAGREGSYPRQLSGGQQQRVAIARALALRPAADAVRRADERARPGTGRRGAVGDPRPGGQRDDDDRGHPRDRLRPRGGRQPSCSSTTVASSSLDRPPRVLASPSHQRARAFLAAVL